SASIRSQDAIVTRCAPPRWARSGKAFKASSAEPKRLIKARNVAGPTFSVRISRSQIRRWRSERRVGILFFATSCIATLSFAAYSGLSPCKKARYIGAMLEEDQQAHDQEQDGGIGVAKTNEHHRNAHRGYERRKR